VRGSLGLGIGLVVGAGAMYLALRPPWGGGTTQSPADAGVVAVGKPDAGTKPSKPRRRPGGQTPRTGSNDDIDEPLPPVVHLSDADRRLEWRGDDMAMPPKVIDMAGSDEGRSLTDAEINGVLSSQTQPLRDCVVQGATNTDLRATTVTVDYILDGRGRGYRARFEAPHYFFEHGFMYCARKGLAVMRFPATGAPTRVTFPIHLD
jgi:hypothetical protein